MEQLFFSKENFNIIYNILKKKINSNTNVDIDTSPKFREELIKIIKTIYKQRNTFNIPSNTSNIDTSRYLSQKVINVSINYFTETIKQSNNNHMNRDINSNNNNLVNQIDTRPQPTTQYNNGTSTVVNNYNKLLNEREQQPRTLPPPINFKENINETNKDIQNKYSELNSKRESEYESLQNSSSNSNTDNNFSNFMNNTLPQQNLLNNPSSSQIQHLLDQQKKLQEQINSIQREDNTNFTFNHPSQISMSNKDQMSQFKASTKQNFNPPPQQNSQFLSDDNKPLNDILQNQFTSITSNVDTTNDMKPDDNIDYDNIMNDINDNTVTLNDQFSPSDENINNNFSTKPFTEETPNINITNNENPNLELDIIKESISKQSTAINNTNSNIEKLLHLHQENDISKYYQTILDIPRLIKEQKKVPLTIKTRNLIVSSRDRNLNNNTFDKYNFRIVFGAEGSQTLTSITNNNINNNMGSVEEEVSDVYTSTGLENPTVSEVLKNVISIKLLRVIIPKPREAYYYPEPYFFVAVDEFKSNIISTKNFTEKIFCKIHFDKELVYNNSDDDEDRKYLYYKNDDDDFTMFYSSPLAKLDRLTLKLLDSEGNNVKESAMKDIDIDHDPDIEGSAYSVKENMYANTFVKDKLCVISNGSINNHRVTQVNKDTTTPTDPKYIISGPSNVDTNDKIINLTNQIEYIFEIKTQEHDPTGQIRPNIDS